MQGTANGLLTAYLGLLAALGPVAARAETITVCWDGSGDHSTIQGGIDAAASGDEVVVCEGTYTGPDNRDLDFGGKAITVRSAAGPEDTIIDCQEAGRGFYFHSGEGSSSVLQGFTITNGYAGTDPALFYGGAIYFNNASSPTVTECRLIGNSANREGGAVFSRGGSNPTITDCVISGNSAPNGGGLKFYGSGSPTVANCTITGNSVYSGNGGGINCYLCASPTITNCTISGNQAVFGNGGGISCYDSCNPIITHCSIGGNRGSVGGGINCEDESDPEIINCALIANTAGETGGGIYCANSSPTITNCTVLGNAARIKGGGIYCHGSVLAIANSIFWNDSAASGPEIALAHQANPSELTVLHCDVEGGQAAAHVDEDCTLLWGEGNIDADPGFAFADDYHLMPGSPCVDTGMNDPPGGLPATDMEGNPRPVDGDGDEDAVADMGVYELNPQAPAIALSPAVVEFFVPEGGPNPPDQILHLRNCGGATLNWEVTACPWLQAIPQTGDSTGEIDEVVLRVDAAGLSHGDHTCVLAVSDPQAVNNPRTATATLHVNLTLHVPSGYPTIQSAIDVSVDGDEIVLADGVYTGSGNKDVDFAGRAITVRSSGGPGSCVIDCQDDGRGFYFRSQESSASILDGLTIVNGYAKSGGAIYCYYHSSPTITNCRLIGNLADEMHGGGGICCFESSPTIAYCEISGNRTEHYYWPVYGGGIHCCYYSNPAIVNCLITANTADREGAGVFCRAESNPTITNCTIAGNYAYGYYGGGGMYTELDSNPTVANCVLWGNSPDQIVGTASATYSDVQSGWPGEGNIDADPMFTLPGDYHLSSSSPCLDAADNDAVPEWITTDFEGNPRFLDEPAAPDTGNGTPPIVDMGVYEFVPPPPADFDRDGDVDLEDFGHFQACLTGPDQGPPSPACEDADLDKDAGTDVDKDDLDMFLACLTGANLQANPDCVD